MTEEECHYCIIFSKLFIVDLIRLFRCPSSINLAFSSNLDADEYRLEFSSPLPFPVGFVSGDMDARCLCNLALRPKGYYYY